MYTCMSHVYYMMTIELLMSTCIYTKYTHACHMYITCISHDHNRIDGRCIYMYIILITI